MDLKLKRGVFNLEFAVIWFFISFLMILDELKIYQCFTWTTIETHIKLWDL